MSKITKLLPVGDPTKQENRQTPQYFYENVIKGLLPHIIDITLQGITVDYNEINNLRDTVDKVLETVVDNLNLNPLIRQYLKAMYKVKRIEAIDNLTSKQRAYTYYIKPFNPSDMAHRSYYMETLLDTVITKYQVPDTLGQLPNGKPKWSVKDVKTFLEAYPDLNEYITPILEKTITKDDTLALDAMRKLATDKTNLYNIKYTSAIKNLNQYDLVGDFNPGSSKQKNELFRMLNIECEAFSKDTGAPSWNREQVERVNRETTDEDVKTLTQAFIDHSFSAIIKNNFIAAFDRYCINDTLYGNLKLAGAKSFRLTSQNP